MKMKEKKELFTKTDSELTTLLLEAKNDLLRLSLDHKQGKLKDTKELGKQRKKIAVILTILRQRILSKNREALQP